MDVRIGHMEATIVDTEGDAGAVGEASIERIARRVLAMLERRRRAEQNGLRDRKISSPDAGDVERYG
jgi:hypothetical protein